MKSLKANVIFLSAHSFFRVRTERGLFLRNTGNGWFAGPALSLKSCKKAVKSMISRPFLVETKRIELSTLRMRTVRSPKWFG